MKKPNLNRLNKYNKLNKSKPKKEMELIFKTVQYHFFDEIIERGSFQETGRYSLLFQTYFFVKRAEKVANNQMLIDFAYQLYIQPNVMKLSTEGSCIMESPTIKHLEKIVKNNKPLFNKMIARLIVKKSYRHIKNILVERKVSLPLPKMEEYLLSCEKKGIITGKIGYLKKRS